MIFGNAAPKFQVSGTDVLLDYAVIERDEIDYKTIEHESDLDRARSFITKPEHHVFQVLIHLHRYQSPKAKYDEIVAHLGTATCQLWRHRDSQAFQDTGSADANFIFLEYQSLYINTTEYADGLRLVFKSAEAIDHSDFGDNWTFARALSAAASNAWYLHHTTGLMTAAADTTTARRLVAGKYKGTALVMEGARTNIITHPSGPFDAGSWAASNLTATANTSETLDPSGTSIADKLAATADGGFVLYTSGTAVGNTATFSVWLKCPTGTVTGNLVFDGTAGGQDSSPITVTTTWQPFSFTQDTSGYGGNHTVAILIDNNTEIMYAWGAQLEDSAEFASTIIDPVATASKTRALEKMTILSANTNFNKLRGTVSMWFKPYWSGTGHGAAQFLFEAGDSGGAAGDRHCQIDYIANSANLRFFLRRDNTTTTGVSLSGAASLTAGTWHHIVCTYDATISNGIITYLDGSQVAASTNDPFNISNVGDTIGVGAIAGGNPPDGEIDELQIFSTVKTAAEVLAIYNLTNGLDRTLEFK